MDYHFAADIPNELGQEVRETIDRVRASETPVEHQQEGADLVLRLTEACLEAYFLRPVRTLQVGYVAEKATALGIKAAYRAIAVFIRRITGRLGDEQMLTLADILEGMLVTLED